MARIRLDLLPQTAHVYVDGAVEGFVGLLALDQIEQLLAGEDPAGVSRQRGEDLVLVGSQALPVAVHPHLAGREIDVQASGDELDRVRLGRRAPQYRADASEQLARIEWLGQVI